MPPCSKADPGRPGAGALIEKQVTLTEEQIEFQLKALDQSAHQVRDYANEHRAFGAERRDRADKTIASIRAALSAARSARRS